MTAGHQTIDRNALVIEIWDFDIVWNLSIVIWDFSAGSGKSNTFGIEVGYCELVRE